MAKTKLTQKALEGIVKANSGQADSKALYVWDTELNGFGAYISSKGDVSWLVQKWIGGRGGKAVRHVIGKSKDGMDLADARSLAASSIGDIHKGIDLSDLKKKGRQAIRDDINSANVKDTLDRFHKKHPSEGSRYLTEREANLRTAFTGYEKRKLKSITRADIRAILETKVTPAASRNLFAALRPFFNWCVEQDLLAVSPLDNLSSPSPVQSRDRQLTKAEIKALWLASYHLPDRWGSFYRMLLLTGQRREEVAGMEWNEIDLDKSIWTIPSARAKNGKAHVVQLSPMAIAELPVSTGNVVSITKRRGFVFPASKVRVSETDKTEASISGFSKMKTKLDGLMTTELAKHDETFAAWRVHDLRRTMASGLAEAGHSTDVVDRILNHVSGSASGVKGVYQRYSFLKERGEALLEWSRIVSSLVTDRSEVESA